MFCPACRADYPAEWKVCPKDATSLLRSPQIGKYTIEGLIGIGGMGAVYRASNPDTRSEVAIKIMNSNVAGAADARQRFQREAAVVAKLKTSHVVKVNDFGTEADGTLYLVMELLDGHNLRDEILAPPALIELARVQFVMEGSLKGLAAAHKAGIVHRDLKPENIFIAQTDDGEVPKLLDFGIARVESAGTELTRTGTMMGTASYMAPEQVAGNVPEIGPWTDVYAMGAILYELLTGKLAFGGASITEVLTKVLQAEVVPLRIARPGLPDAIYDIVHRCLKLDRASRPQNADELRLALATARLAPHGATIPDARKKEVPSGVAATIGATEPGASPSVKSTLTPIPAVSRPSPPASELPQREETSRAPMSRPRLVIGAALGGATVLAIGVGAFFALRSNKDDRSPRADDKVAEAATTDVKQALRDASAPGASTLDAAGGAQAPAPDPESTLPGADPLATYSVPIDGDVSTGPADAKVTMVVAGEDYACPYCEKVRPTLAELREKYGKDLRIIHKAFVVHQSATAAALATCAAAKQGKYEPFSELLWERSYKPYSQAKTRDVAVYFDAKDCWATTGSGCPIVDRLAAELHLDVARFKQDMIACVDSIARDAQHLGAVGVTGIPTFYINGRYLSGAQPIGSFVPLIDAELRKASERIQGGTVKADYYQRWVIDAGLKQVAAAVGDPPAPPDVAGPPADATRTAKGGYYKLLRSGGSGRHPGPIDTVQVHYTAWMTNGHMFDSSVKRGTPVDIQLDEAAPGWIDALQLMGVGDKMRLWLPSALAYDPKVAKGLPDQLIVVDIELLKITPSTPRRPGQASVPKQLDRPMVEAVVNKIRPQIGACKDPNVTGIVTLSVTITPDGQVSTAIVKETTASVKASACVAGMIKGAVFPPTERGAVVTVPFAL